MVFEISRREVLNNLIRFKDNLLEIHDQGKGFGSHEERKEEEQGKKGKRTYKLLLNRKTGDMRFAKRISSMEHHISQKTARKEHAEDWKEVRMIVSHKSSHGVAHFEISDEQNHSLKPSDIDPLAWKIASETLDILNQKAEEVKQVPAEMLPEEAVLEDLSSIHIAVTREEVSDLPGWMGSLSRIDAEQRLKQKPVGTYLLREGDEITLSASFHFAEENVLSIHPYLLTVVEKEKKISDILFLKTNKGWVFYHDNPDLKDRDIYFYYRSPRELLQSINQIARHPVL